MPVLLVYGMPGTVGKSELTTLIVSLQLVTAVGLDILPSEVSVFFPTDRVQLGLGEELVCIVEGIFEKPERTIVVRETFAHRVLEVLREFVKASLPGCHRIEVVLHRFDQNADGFAFFSMML